jgi:hypothetical protein
VFINQPSYIGRRPHDELGFAGEDMAALAELRRAERVWRAQIEGLPWGLTDFPRVAEVGREKIWVERGYEVKDVDAEKQEP